MASGQFAVVYRQIGRLFQSGSLAGLSEGQLLDRFIARRDNTAFEAIIARHGPMVLGVCRAILHDPNDVDDAFQATFLVLVKKAGTLAHRDLLGNWLYGVAHRVAKRARIEAARRRDRESSGPDPAGPNPVDFDRIDVRPMIHDELNRLPESYRAAVVLCYLEGQTHEEAARQLGWPVGTVKGRLARAKDLLRDRLTRRGLAIPSSALVAVLAKDGQAAVAPTLLESTTTAAIAIATTPLAALASASLHAWSPHAIVLTQGVLQTMSTAKLKLAATVLVAGMLSATGVSAYQNADSQPTRSAIKVGGPSPSRTGLSPARRRVEARLEVAEEAMRRLKEMPKPDPPLYNRWRNEVQQARNELENIRIQEEGPAYYINKAERQLREAREHADQVEQKVQSGQTDMMDFLDAQLRRIKAEEVLDQIKNQYPEAVVQPPAPSAEKAKEGGAGPGGLPVPTKPEAGEIGAANPDNPPRRKTRNEHPADIERNRKIEAALEKVVAMSFPQATPLQDVLKYIKEQTKDEKGRTIPIYLDPSAESDAEKTGLINRPVSIDIDDLPLRTTLRLVLKQAGLEYRIRDGLLFISDPQIFEEEENPAPRPQHLSEHAGFQ